MKKPRITIVSKGYKCVGLYEDVLWIPQLHLSDGRTLTFWLQKPYHRFESPSETAVTQILSLFSLEELVVRAQSDSLGALCLTIIPSE